ncbi:hypothetical protein [Pseudomonas sp. LFM046]|uniref:hypothetical protein n=1 Tax=Pseudomonas sp. LFM046 TaxID=1608357 RepID=UPI0005CFEBA0|nr:hypothetical protein [Pseudomonas sp. LFM046]
MPDRNNLQTALYRISQNQAAIACAIVELANWADSCGQKEVAERIRNRLGTLLDNADAISRSLTELAIPVDKSKANRPREAE